MSAEDVFATLRRNAQQPTKAEPEPERRYGFGGGQNTYKAPSPQPGGVVQKPNSVTTGDNESPPRIVFKRDAAGDRPAAEEPPPPTQRPVQMLKPLSPSPRMPPSRNELQHYEEGPMEQPRGNDKWDILIDLGFRLFEVGIAAAAFAIGDEILHFFKKRRFQR